MALVDWSGKKIETVGAGKNKVEKIEVAFGVSTGTGTSIPLDKDGVFFKETLVTGASLDEPFGLQLMKMEMFHSVPATLATDMYLGASCFANDETIEDQELVGTQSNWELDTILTNQAIFFVKDANAPSYDSVVVAPEGQRLFVAPNIELHGHLFAETYATRTISSTWKYTFKKVKMTKNAYLEKLASRAYT